MYLLLVESKFIVLLDECGHDIDFGGYDVLHIFDDLDLAGSFDGVLLVLHE
jgi:hypothetical protein